MPRGLDKLPPPVEFEQPVKEWLKQIGSTTALDNFKPVSYHRGYLSTMVTIRRGDQEYLLSIKQFDECRQRAIREADILQALNGTFAPRLVCADYDVGINGLPVVATECLVSVRDDPWRDPNPEGLGRVLATLHLNSELQSVKTPEGAPDLVEELHLKRDSIEKFTLGELKAPLLSMLKSLESSVARWRELFDRDSYRFVHGDLPHGHLLGTAAGPKAIHWEFSGRRHPSAELARSYWHVHASPENRRATLASYHARVPWKISESQLKVQALLNNVYELCNMGFWLDRWGYRYFPDRVQEVIWGAEMFQVVANLKADDAFRLA
jgi:hypothetical protein